MIIQKAHSSDVDRIVSFYEALTEKLAKSGYDLPWRVGIYPTREQFETAVARQSLYLCTEQNTIIGAAILNHEQGDGYDTVKWECTPDPDEIAGRRHIRQPENARVGIDRFKKGLQPAVIGHEPHIFPRLLRQSAVMLRHAGLDKKALPRRHLAAVEYPPSGKHVMHDILIPPAGAEGGIFHTGSVTDMIQRKQRACSARNRKATHGASPPFC